MSKKDVSSDLEQAVNEVAQDAAAPEENVTKTIIVCPHCGGQIELAAPAHKRRGQLAGIAIEDMTDEQLKIELINANSVLYKAQQRKASAETIAKNQARVDAAKVEKAKRDAAKAPVVEAPVVEAPVEA